MKKFGFLALALTGLTGCHGPSTAQLVDGIQKEMGIKVEVKADANDECAREQLQALVDEYNNLDSDANKATVKQAMMKFKGFTLEPTMVTRKMSGVVARLELYQTAYYDGYYGSGFGCHYGYPCFGRMSGGMAQEYLVADRELANDVTVTGTAPATQINKAEALSVTAQATWNGVEYRTYTTGNSYLYQTALSVGELDSYGMGYYHSMVGTQCATRKILNELMN